MKLTAALPFAATIAVLLGACASHPVTSLPPPPASGGDDYPIQPGDLLVITFAGEPDYNQQVRVDWNGHIHMPSIAHEGSPEISAAGISPTALGRKLGEAAAENKVLVSPRVQVLVSEYAPQTFVVLGQVAQPGRFNFPRGVIPRLSLEEAIGQVGGCTRLARQTQIMLRRDAKVYTIDLRKLSTESGQSPVLIVPGDVITVPERVF